VELGLFALHTVLYPGQTLQLVVFEDRYRALMEDVLPEGSFAVVAIRRGQEVGGDYEPYDVGVRVTPVDYEVTDEGSYQLEIRADERLRLLEQTRDEPFPTWRVEPVPESGSATPEAAARALAAWRKFLAEAEMEAEGDLPEDSVLLSYALAASLPTLLPDHQALLELPGPAERLAQVARAYRMEAGLLRALKGRRPT
jgi:Lon protease-like protein